MLSRSEKVANKSDVSCKDTKVTSKAICEALQGLDYCKAKCPEVAEYSTTISNLPILEIRDHHEWNEDFQKDKTDYRECRNVEKDKALSYCKSLLSSRNDHEHQDPSITDPLLAHELLLPYNRIPEPRLFCANDEDAECTAAVLPKRHPSPVRHILPGRFDLHAKTEELLKRRDIAKARKYLWEFKDRISQSVKQVWDANVDLDLVICMVVLQALCENVILTMVGANIGIDIHTFVNMAVNWTLVDLRILDPSMLSEEECTMFTELELFDTDTRPTSREVIVSSKLRRTLFEVQHLKFDPHVSMHLHRSLPWSLVSPAHQSGVVKFYPNVRERINEKLSDFQHAKSAYVPDVTCFHFKEVPDQANMI